MLRDFSSHAHALLVAMLDRPEWSGGGRLPPETELAKNIGVSRPVLRQALAQLRKEGRIVSRRGSGNFVQPRVIVGAPDAEFASLSIRTVHDMKNCMRFRQVVECAAAQDAARTAPPALVAEIEQAHRALIEKPPAQPVFEADFNFHLAIARASMNPYYEVALQTLRKQIALGQEFGRKLRDVPANEVSGRVVEEHEEVLNAIRNRDPEQARSAMESHIAFGIQRLFGTEA